jgi:pyridoxal phosphate enzyme (YggS family)
VTASVPTLPLSPAYAADVAARVREVQDRIAHAQERGGHGQPVTLIAVTKTHGPEAVQAALAAGVSDVGENRIQEAEQKRAALSELPVRWHLIGHVQRNKARAAITFDLVHGVDSSRLAVALHEAASAEGRRCDVLVQVNVSGEASKYGLGLSDVPAFAEQLQTLSALQVRGVMTMAPFDAPESVLRDVFGRARTCAAMLHDAGHDASVLSMGMSGDFEVAIEEGATHVRLGTILFGARAN